jgi:hypothetical protein
MRARCVARAKPTNGTSICQSGSTDAHHLTINAEIGTLEGNNVCGALQFSQLLLDLPLDRESLAALGIDFSEITRFRRIDDASIIRPLYDLACEVCTRRYDLAPWLP